MKYYNKFFDERAERVLGQYRARDNYINTATDHAFAFSNENLTDTIGGFDMTGKRVATVGSSADQVLMSVLCGSKDVTLIDGGLFATAVAQLKIAGIKNMEYEDFCNWWCEKNILEPKMYAKVSHDIEPKCRVFWDMIMMDTTNDMVINDSIFASSFDGFFNGQPYRLSVNSNFYQVPELYDELRQKLKDAKITYKEAVVEDFPNKLQGKYDYIFLSNIFSYANTVTYFETVSRLYNENLNNGGAIEIYYGYEDYPGDHFMGCVNSFVPEFIPYIEHKSIRSVISLENGIDAPLYRDCASFLVKNEQMVKE